MTWIRHCLYLAPFLRYWASNISENNFFPPGSPKVEYFNFLTAQNYVTFYESSVDRNSISNYFWVIPLLRFQSTFVEVDYLSRMISDIIGFEIIGYQPNSILLTQFVKSTTRICQTMFLYHQIAVGLYYSLKVRLHFVTGVVFETFHINNSTFTFWRLFKT